MRSSRVWVLAVCLCTVIPAPGLGQGVGGSVHLGTLGLGGRITLPLLGSVNLRGGVDFQPVDLTRNHSDVTYDLSLPSPSVSALLDWHPGRSGFRLSGGASYFVNELELRGTPFTDVDIGGQSYPAAQIGSLIGSLGTAQVAPYAGIGWGDATGAGLGLTADIGVAIHGTPDVALRATGPIAGNSVFQADLESEIQDINDEIKAFKLYPILNLGLSFGL